MKSLVIICLLIAIADSIVVVKGPYNITKNLKSWHGEIGCFGCRVELDSESQVSVRPASYIGFIDVHGTLKNSAIDGGLFFDVNFVGSVNMENSRIGTNKFTPETFFFGFITSHTSAIEMKDSRITFDSINTHDRIKRHVSGGYMQVEKKFTMKSSNFTVGPQSFINAGCNSVIHGHVKVGTKSDLILDNCSSFFVGPHPPSASPPQLDLAKSASFNIKGPVAVYLSDTVKLQEYASLRFFSDGKAPFTCYSHEPVVVKGNVEITAFDSPNIPVGLKCHEAGHQKAKELQKLLL